MANPPKIVVEVPLPREVHAALKGVASEDDRSIASAIRIAIKRYIENPAGVAKPPLPKVVTQKEGTPQQRAAQTRAEREVEKKEQAVRERAALLPEVYEGYEVRRYGITDWPNEDHDGYKVVPTEHPEFGSISIRIPMDEWEASQIVTETRLKRDPNVATLEDIDDEDWDI